MTYADHRAALVAYLQAKVNAEDWHAVRDAAVDIEILEAKQTRPAEYRGSMHWLLKNLP